MAKCSKCDKEFEPCYLCRGQYPHQRCVNDDMCHECFMVENPNGRLGVTNKSSGQETSGEIWTNEDEAAEIERHIIEDNSR